MAHGSHAQPDATHAAPLMSVVMPVCDQVSFLAEAVHSVLAQSLTDLELVLVDDGSSDGSGELCDTLAREDARVRVIHQEFQGVAAARNTGLDAACGEWLAFVDADDVIGPAYLRILLDAAREQGADIAVSKVIRFEVKPSARLAATTSDTSLISGRDICRITYTRKANDYIFDALWGKVYRRSLFDGIRFPAGKTREDAAVAHALLYPQERVVLCPDCFYGYRTNPNGIMSKPTSAESFDAMDAFEARLAYYERVGDDELLERTQRVSDLWRATYIAEMYIAGTEAEIPERWRMDFGEVLRVLGAHAGSSDIRILITKLLDKTVRAQKNGQ